MKKQLLKKFYSYIIVMFSFLTANAQIICHPGGFAISCTYHCDDSSIVDLNNDAVNDYRFSVSTYVGALGAPNGAFIYVSSMSVSYLATDTSLSFGDSINASLNWQQTTLYLRTCTSLTGGSCLGWTDSSSHYLGLKFISGTDTYYGWIQLTVIAALFPSHASCSTSGWGYNSTPNQFILAGDTCLGTTGIIENIVSSSINLFPNPATNSVTIKFPSDETGEIQIVNLFGQIIFYEKVFADETKIDLNRLAAGMYVARWSSGENFQTAKFSIVK